MQEMSLSVRLSTLGADLDCHVSLPMMGTRGGILIAWKSTACMAITTRVDMFSTSVLFRNGDGLQWWFTGIYGPQLDHQKLLFLDELQALQTMCIGPWTIAGDFNLLYRAADKSNPNVDRAMMGCFRRLIDDLELKEIQLLGRRFTWSNEHSAPTLVRLDRVFYIAP